MKMFKSASKLLGIVLMIALVLSMGTMALAADGDTPTTYTITITKDTSDKAAHTYGAFQIFKGDLDEKTEGTTSTKTLSNIQWGDGITPTETLIAAINNALDLTGDAALAADASAATVAKAISDKSLTFDSAGAQALADAFNAALKTTPSKTGTIAVDATSGTITGLSAGYYLIKDTADVDGEGALTRFMLEVVSNVEVTEKASVPTLTKKVKEKNDTTGSESGWQDAADYDIGDTIPYQITGTLPSKFAEFDTYKTYTITDTLSAGLTAPAATDITVKVGETDVTSHFDITITGANTAEQVITIKLNDDEDLKKWTSPALTKDSTFVVDYSATLNTAAVIGSVGNPNTAKLEFSNNPNYDSDGDTGTTPEDKVIVFTYEIKALKVEPDGDAIDKAAYDALSDADKANYVKVGDKWQKTKALSGAGFTLYKDVNGTYTAVGEEIKGATTFEFKGTDAGNYKLVETTVPAGYNKCEDIEIIVTATYDATSADPKLTSLTVSPETAGFVVESTSITDEEGNASTTTSYSGNITGKVLNQKGTVLPSTGGIGTTLFYAIGGVMVLAAVVMLISKRRVG